MWNFVLAIGLILALALLVYELTKAGSGIRGTLKSIKDWIVGPDVVVPKAVQDYINQPSNQPGGYIPWTPNVEDDEQWPPAWLFKKGA
jgi:hypothetical protein